MHECGKGGRQVFQSTLPREERRCVLQSGSQGLYFNPRSHERSDRLVRSSAIPMSIFQSTLPREERLRPPSYLTPEQKFQSTLPREERPMTDM